ncbi:Tho complex subunit 7-domain-containing protein [Apodospora peruviana]|uniref:Tho complex subunit 7-domain-containing protein n=1 Tax=Apodospora peruviana TaxID=516989 RepID=A0AAE0MF41_9PEZI|nr:Tho complex subunit 7-domain-containing protein [Apodospora peruviana]
MASSWGLLDEKEENELHKTRLLNVEEKPFKRVTKRLSILHSMVVTRARQAPTPPPESKDSANHDASSPITAIDNSFLADLSQMREDITLDFAAFDSSIARLQFLMTANEKERERYAAERERIIKTSQAVRDNTASLRGQLDQARATLEQRKKFDELADKITSNPSLRPRTEQATSLSKLEEEIAELEAESKTYGVTWQERRDQFARIMDESMRLRRLIRDEKEEVERREGMGDGGDGGDAEAGQTPRPGLASGSNTPRPESGLLPRGSGGGGADSGDAAGTPRPLSTTGGRTPARESPAPGQDSQSFLKPRPDAFGASFSRSESQALSREASVEVGGNRDETQAGEDVEMGESARADVNREEEEEEPDSPLTPLPSDDPPQIVFDDQDDGPEDSMDTT